MAPRTPAADHHPAPGHQARLATGRNRAMGRLHDNARVHIPERDSRARLLNPGGMRLLTEPREKVEDGRRDELPGDERRGERQRVVRVLLRVRVLAGTHEPRGIR